MNTIFIQFNGLILVFKPGNKFTALSSTTFIFNRSNSQSLRHRYRQKHERSNVILPNVIIGYIITFGLKQSFVL